MKQRTSSTSALRVPLQVSVSGTSTVTITCPDPRATTEDNEIVLVLDPPQPVCLVVEDLPDTSFMISSGPQLERPTKWKRAGTTSYSPDLLPGFNFEIVAEAWREPPNQQGAAQKFGHGVKGFKIRGPGAPTSF